MRRAVLAIMMLWPFALMAQPLPALYDVRDVAADDVLNIRVDASASSSIIGVFTPDQKGIEVIALSENGKWGRVNTGETPGWAAMRYLQPAGGPGWASSQSAVYCYGTEPFWSFRYDPGDGKILFQQMGQPDETPPISQILTSVDGYPPEMQIRLDHIGSFSATFTGQSCYDGMSDREFGIEARLLWVFSEGLAPSSPLMGCCSLSQ